MHVEIRLRILVVIIHSYSVSKDGDLVDCKSLGQWTCVGH